MRRLRSVSLAGLLSAALGAQVAPARAQGPEKTDESGDAAAAPPATHAKLGPGEGAGERRVGDTPAAPTSDAAANEASEKSAANDDAVKGDEKVQDEKSEKKRSSKPSHRRGRAPKKPSPTLPEGAPRAEPNQAARRIVANGPTAEDVQAGKDDPELRSLREADRVLFPKPLPGAVAGWSWDLPDSSAGSDRGPDVVASGLPPSADLDLEKSQSEAVQDAEFLRSLTMPDLPVRLDARVVKYLKFYRDTRRGQAIAKVWAKKSGRFVPAIKAELARARLPTDLVWLSLIESGHNPGIHSHAGAAGLWQFIPEAGKLYGLTVDRWVDERLDPRRSTEAAIRYLSDLYQRFGNWDLAMSAYNMGYGGLTRAIRKFNTNDFWELSRHEAGMPWETSLYVPKILAIAVVMNNKKAFGLEDVSVDEAVSFDTVRVPANVELAQVARAAEVPVAELRTMNAHYLQKQTPPSSQGAPSKWRVYVPKGKGVATQQKLAKTKPREGVSPYVVRFGDTTEAIAADHGISESSLRRLNDLDRDEQLEAGAILLVPESSKRGAIDAPSDEGIVVVPARHFEYPDRRRVFYEVRYKDTLDAVARAFGVTPTELSMWNSLDRSARLVSGMVLQLFVRRSHSLTGVRHLEGDHTRVLVAGSDEFFDHFEGLKGRKRLTVTVRKGESLQKIGARYGLSVGSMERINRRSRWDDLEPGDRVIVYAKASSLGAGTDDDPGAGAPLPEVEAPAPEALP